MIRVLVVPVLILCSEHQRPDRCVEVEHRDGLLLLMKE